MYAKFFKRVEDIVFSLICIIVFIPVWIIVPILIKRDDGGSVFYLAPRIGKDCKKFYMYKFRSMNEGNKDIRNPDGSTYNAEDDPRVTRIGKKLRKTSIDELPQLFNVLKGEMSLIGPRASTWDSLESYKEDEKDKMKVRPGISGYTQAYYRNSISSREKRLYDARYANNVTFLLDVKIVFKTLQTVFGGKGLYTNDGKNNNNIKMLLLPPYFYPEQTASTHLDQDRYSAYKNEGILTEVYVASPTRGVDANCRKKYKKIKNEKMFDNSVSIHRFPMFREGKNPVFRALRYVLVNFVQYMKGTNEDDIDVIYSGSTPPTQGVLCGLVKKKLSKKYRKKIPYVYNLQDVFPDSLVNTGMTRKGSLLWKIGRRIENYTYKNADKIIVISEGFKRNIMAKGVPEEKIEVISNWIDLDSVQPVSRKDNKLIDEFGIDPNKFLVVYAGNFGAAQGADVVLKAAEKLKGEADIQFVIFGGGAYFEEAKKEAERLDNVFIHELMPADRISEVYSLGDVALITCKLGTGNAGMPSKTWSIMACNTPIIASFDTDSDLADVIRDSGAGKCVEPGDVDALVKAIETEHQMWSVGNSRFIELRKYVLENASKEKCVKRYIRTIMDVYNTES